MTDVGRIFGDVLGGNAFGDWSLRPEDGRAFTEAGIALYHAPRTMAGEDRFDPSILLEVCDWIRDREDCQFIILGSGDSDYQVLVDRARALECRIIRCAFRQAVGREMLAAAPLFPLEAELGIYLAEHGDVEVQTRAPQENAASSGKRGVIRQRSGPRRLHHGDEPPRGPHELRRLQRTLQPVDAGLGHCLERVRMPQSG